MAKIEMYTTDWCPYCVRAKSLLKARGVTEIAEILAEDRAEVLERSGRMSVPQIFIDNVHVGGYDDLVVWDRDGRLAAALTDDPAQ